MSLKKAAPIIGSVALALTFAACKDSQQAPAPEPDTGKAPTVVADADIPQNPEPQKPTPTDRPGIDTQAEAIDLLRRYIKSPCEKTLRAQADGDGAILIDQGLCKKPDQPNMVHLTRSNGGETMRLTFGRKSHCPDQKFPTPAPGFKSQLVALKAGSISDAQEQLRQELLALFTDVKKTNNSLPPDNMYGGPKNTQKCEDALGKARPNSSETDGPGIDTFEEAKALLEKYLADPCNKALRGQLKSRRQAEADKTEIRPDNYTPPAKWPDIGTLSDQSLCENPQAPNEVSLVVWENGQRVQLIYGGNGQTCVTDKGWIKPGQPIPKDIGMWRRKIPGKGKPIVLSLKKGEGDETDQAIREELHQLYKNIKTTSGALPHDGQPYKAKKVKACKRAENSGSR